MNVSGATASQTHGQAVITHGALDVLSFREKPNAECGELRRSCAEKVLKNGWWELIVASTQSDDEVPLRFEGFTIDLYRRGLYRGAERIHLTPIPFKVLTFLVQKRGFVVSKRELLEAIWGEQRDANTVEQTIRQIRCALGDEKEQPRFIRTISGVGYSFVAEIQANNEADVGRIPALGVRKAGRVAVDRGSRVDWMPRIATLLMTVVGCSVIFAILAFRHATAELAVSNPVKITRSRSHILSPLVGDGHEVYFPRYQNGRYSIAVVSSDGGESALVATGLNNPELCDLAPDGTMLLRDLVHSRDELDQLYVQPRAGPERKVGNILAYDAAWYPDSKRIIYSADGVVYATDSPGSFSRYLFKIPGNAFWFRWSPDGKELRFTVIDKSSEVTSIWGVTAEGKQPHRIFPDLRNQICCGSWTPDGKYFIFQVRVGNIFQIWAQQDPQSHLSPLRNPPFPLIFGPMSYRGPLPSKDGKELFVRAEAPKGELVRYDATVREFIPVLPSISARTLAYSRDRKWIAYTSLADNQLWRCRTDGTECLQLTHGLKNTSMARWSPDGGIIAYMGLGFTGTWTIYAVPANGGASRPLACGEQAKGYPDWSPDGQRVVFSDVPPVSQAQGIYLLNLHSSKVTMLPHSVDYSFPRWSPDGHFLVALHSGDLHLHIFDFSTAKWKPLGDIPAAYPNWSHDGTYVYFRSYTSETPGIFRISVTNRTLQKVATLAGVERGPFFMGDWIGLAPDDSPVAVRNSTIEDIYSWNLIGR